MYLCVCVYKCVEVRTDVGCVPLTLLILFLVVLSLLQNLVLNIQIGWLVNKSLGTTDLCFFRTGIIAMLLCMAFYMGDRHPNSDPNACLASTLPTKPSVKSLILNFGDYFIWNINNHLNNDLHVLYPIDEIRWKIP